jgi:hypothetical protein
LGGEIFLVSPIYEGMAATHREALQVTPLSLEEAMRQIRRGQFKDNVGAAIATYQIKLRSMFGITVVSEHLTEEEARLLGVTLCPAPEELQALIDRRLKQKPDLKIGLLYQSTEQLPHVHCIQ